MTTQNLVLSLIITISLCSMNACTHNEDSEKAAFQEVPELIEIRPEKPVKIKLKRNASGNYAWELSGDNAEKVIETDTFLRESLEKRPSTGK